MMSMWLFIVSSICVVACGLVSGVFLTFSDFVMKSLRGAQQSAGIEVMQVINRKVYKSVFMVLLLGMSAVSTILLGYGLLIGPTPENILIMTGSGIYFIGVFLVSMVFNVPMNKRLESMEYSSSAAALYWTDTYVPRWVFWNTVRTIASAAASVCFLVVGLQFGV